MLHYFATVLLIGLRDYGTGKWEGGAADCDHSQKLGGNGSASAKQVTSGGTQAYQHRGTCPKCGAIRTDQQIGMEETPELFIARLVDVFREVRRVLKDDGVLWVNIGDSYAGGGTIGRNDTDPASLARRAEKYSTGQKSGSFVGSHGNRPQVAGLKSKDLVGIPWMLAFALRADGWYLRSEIIWHKLNPMPESVTDRPTKAHEQIFLLSKSPKYFYDAEAISEPAIHAGKMVVLGEKSLSKGQANGANVKASGNGKLDSVTVASNRNRRSVWSIASQPFAAAHFATFPPALIEPCILAGSRIGDTILDPFGGSGTTAQVANKFGRKAVLIELNPEYCELAMKRNRQKTLFAGSQA